MGILVLWWLADRPTALDLDVIRKLEVALLFAVQPFADNCCAFAFQALSRD